MSSFSFDTLSALTVAKCRGGYLIIWCAREDLNLHPLRDQILSLARLPFRHARNGAEDASAGVEAQVWFSELLRCGTSAMRRGQHLNSNKLAFCRLTPSPARHRHRRI